MQRFGAALLAALVFSSTRTTSRASVDAPVTSRGVSQSGALSCQSGAGENRAEELIRRGRAGAPARDKARAVDHRLRFSSPSECSYRPKEQPNVNKPGNKQQSDAQAFLAIYRKYYGTAFAIRITALMFITMVIAALIIDGLFSGAGLIPHGVRPTRGDIFGSIKLDYKLVLNLLGLVAFAALFWLTVRRGVSDPVCGMKVDRAKALTKTGLPQMWSTRRRSKP